MSLASARHPHAARTVLGAALVAAALVGLAPEGVRAQGVTPGATPGVTPAAPSAAAGVTVTPPWLRARLDARLDARTRAAVERVVDSAYLAGIPAEPLVDKALEGASKRAPGEVIVRAVRTLALALGTARQQLGPQSLPSELTAGAAAVRAGVDAEALRTLRQDRPGQPLTVSLGVLADLVASGVSADAATRTVLSLTKAGLVDEQLVAFRRDVERDIGIGAPPATALARFLDRRRRARRARAAAPGRAVRAVRWAGGAGRRGRGRAGRGRGGRRARRRVNIGFRMARSRAGCPLQPACVRPRRRRR